MSQSGPKHRNLNSVDQERAELQIAIKECEAAIKKQEDKSIEAQIELSKVKQEAESKILEKNHLIADVRKITGAELDNSQGEDLQNGYIDFGDGCWRRNVFLTTFRCW